MLFDKLRQIEERSQEIARRLADPAIFSQQAEYARLRKEHADSQEIEAQIERESHAFFISARLYDDGVIDPRDTRTILGMALSAAHSQRVEGRRGFGVFRM